MLAKY